jgi:hypothetical protein
MTFHNTGNLRAGGVGILITARDDVLLEGSVHRDSGHLNVVAADDIVQNANLSTSGGKILA